MCFPGIASYCSPPLLPASARIVHGEVITANGGGGADSGINENDDLSSEVGLNFLPKNSPSNNLCKILNHRSRAVARAAASRRRSSVRTKSMSSSNSNNNNSGV